jgi:hypothetical protein
MIMIQMTISLYKVHYEPILSYLIHTEVTWDARLGAPGTSQFKSTSSTGAAGGLKIDLVAQPSQPIYQESQQP